MDRLVLKLMADMINALGTRVPPGLLLSGTVTMAVLLALAIAPISNFAAAMAGTTESGKNKIRKPGTQEAGSVS